MMQLPSELIKRKDWWSLGRVLDSLLMPKPTDRHSFCRAFRNSTQSIATTTFTDIGFNVDQVPNFMHDPATNNERFYARVTGPYIFSCAIEWASNSSGYRQLRFRHFTAGGTASTIALCTVPAINGAGTPLALTTMYFMLAGEYVTAQTWQNVGSNVNISTVSNYAPSMNVLYIAPNR